MAEADPNKQGSGQLLDELLGIDPSAFEDDERTQVFRSDPPPPEDTPDTASAAEDDAPTGIPAPVVPRPSPPVPIAAERLAALPLPPPPGMTPPPAPSRAKRKPAPAPVNEGEERVSAIPEVAASEILDESEHAQLVPPVAPVATPFAPNGDAPPTSRDGTDPLLGELIDGRYRVIRILGVGGIGLVYLCQHEVLEKPVAIKILRREYVAHDDLNERFLNEARASSAIKSPRIVDTLDVGSLPDSTPYFVMEYVEGETLAALLDREGALAPKLAIDIAKQMSEGLDAAHAAGVIHRDLKPENVFLAPQPDGALFVKIFDFGIAKVARARKRLTYAGAVFGTPHYMSPEQARGDEVDQRSDLYALGVMLFEMLTGNVPFDGEDPLAVMSQHVDRVPPLMSSLPGVSMPSVLEAIVARCLAKDARDRYPSANDLLADLQSIPEAELAAASATRVAPAPGPASAPVASAPAASTPSLTPSPARLPSLQQPRTETLHALVSSPDRPGKRNRLLWGGLIAAGVVSVAVVVWAARHETSPSTSVAAAQGQAVAPNSGAGQLGARTGVEAAGPTKREVHFVLSPIDAHLFKGEEDLGPMPVSVQVAEGSSETLTVRRKGYTARRIVVDGSETRVVVGLLRAEQQPTVSGKLQSLFKKKTK